MDEAGFSISEIRLFFDLALTLFARVLRAGANVIIVAFVARLISKDSLGGFFLSFGISIPLAFVLPVGLGLATVKAVAGAKNSCQPKSGYLIFAAHLAVILVSSVLLCLFVPALQLIMPSLSSEQVLLSCLIGFVAGLQNFQSDCFRSVALYKESSLYANTLPALVPLGFIAFIYYAGIDVGLSDVLALYLLGSLIALAISTLVINMHLNVFAHLGAWRGALRELLTLIKSGSGNLAGLSVGVLLPSIALYLCALWFSSAEVASLGLAQRILFFVSLPLWLASTVLPPRVSSLIHSENYVDLKVLLSGFSALIVSTSLVLALLITLYGDHIVLFISGNNDPLSVRLLTVLSWFTLLYATFAVALSAVMVSKNNGGLHLSFIVAIATFAVMAYPLTVSYGVLGLAMAQSFAALMNATVGQILLRKNTGIWVWPCFVSAWKLLDVWGKK